MNRVREIERINTVEVENGISESASWHAHYKHSAYVIVANVDFRLTEGDLLRVFSQCGEIVDLNLIRDKATGKSRGFVFLAYEDQRSTILAVDNFNGAQLLGRTLRVDHVAQYRRPKSSTEAGSEGVNETDEDYDARRRRIWDYEAYKAPASARAPPSAVHAAHGANAVAAQDESASQRQTRRIEEVRQRRKQRALQQQQQQQQHMSAHSRQNGAKQFAPNNSSQVSYSRSDESQLSRQRRRSPSRSRSPFVSDRHPRARSQSPSSDDRDHHRHRRRMRSRSPHRTRRHRSRSRSSSKSPRRR